LFALPKRNERLPFFCEAGIEELLAETSETAKRAGVNKASGMMRMIVDYGSSVWWSSARHGAACAYSAKINRRHHGTGLAREPGLYELSRLH
jgi:hypothetical protein